MTSLHTLRPARGKSCQSSPRKDLPATPGFPRGVAPRAGSEGHTVTTNSEPRTSAPSRTLRSVTPGISNYVWNHEPLSPLRLVLSGLAPAELLAPILSCARSRRSSAPTACGSPLVQSVLGKALGAILFPKGQQRGSTQRGGCMVTSMRPRAANEPRRWPPPLLGPWAASA